MKKVMILIATLFATSLMASDGAALYQKCAACHGASGEKAALNKSEVIKGWSKEQTVEALKGYQDGTYGKAMKGLMKGQVASFSDKDIESVAEYIATFK